jgi:hypothetical protein
MPEAMSPAPLMQLAMGITAAKILAVALERGVFDALAEGATATADDLARQTGLRPRPARVLLSGCTSLGLLTLAEGRYANSPLSEKFLVRGRRHYFGDLIAMFDRRVYPGLMRLNEAIAVDKPTTWDPEAHDSIFSGAGDQELADFWDAMKSLSSFTARQLSSTVDLATTRRLLDLGGGGGAYAIELCRKYPGLEVSIFDLPPVCKITEPIVTESSLAERISLIPGNFFADDQLPGGHDAVLLSMVLHDWGPEENKAIIAKSFAALDSDGRILLNDMLLDDSKAGPPDAALMGALMLAETRAGRTYTPQEYQSWLTEAGFVDTEVVRYHGVGANAVVLARKP